MYRSAEPAGENAHLIPYLVVRTATGLNRAWLAQLRVHGMTVARWQILTILAEYDGARLGQLATMSGAEQPTTTRVVDQMERDGLVRRRVGTTDRRAVEVWLTDTGRATFTELLPEAERFISAALRGVDAATAQTLMDALATVTANVEGIGPPAQAHVDTDTDTVDVEAHRTPVR